jgi:hypothetical protein
MDDKWASNNLRTIRTLMERAALYRRAMGPVLLVVGLTGIVAGIVGMSLTHRPALPAVGYWLVVAALCVAEACWMIRLQAIRQREKFWSSPMRRIVQAVLPPFLTGLLASLPFAGLDLEPNQAALFILPGWMVLYGIGMHAAGFFMPRGFKLFGWLFILSGLLIFGGLLLLAQNDGRFSNMGVHALMGLFFGGGHLAYGLYLHFTEKRGTAP